MDRSTGDVTEFLSELSGKRGDEMRFLDAAITEKMPDSTRHLYEGRFWGGSDQQIIGYGVMDYTNRSGDEVEWFVVGLAAQKDHISIYVNAVEDGVYLLRHYEKKLGRARVGSASVAFKSIGDLDFDVLMELIERVGRV